MYHDVYLLRSDAEKPLGLNDLETFVHHRRGIYGYLVAHRPVRVLEGVTGLRPGNPRLLPSAERPAGSRQVYLGQGVAVCPEQALEDCRMFRIHREYRHAVLFRKFHYDRTSRHKCLFVRKRYGLARLNRGDSGAKPAETDHGGEYDVDAVRFNEVADRVHTGKNLYHLGL